MINKDFISRLVFMKKEWKKNKKMVSLLIVLLVITYQFSAIKKNMYNLSCITEFIVNQKYKI